jgi:hypothetical protein
MDKKPSTNMYELLSVSNQKPKKEPKIEPEPKKIGGLDTLSGFLNAPNLFKDDDSLKQKTKVKIVKGDFYKDPELISKNCELFEPETPVIYTESEVVFNEHQKYKGILVMTEFRLIFEFFDKEQKKSIKLPKDYLKFPIFSIINWKKILTRKNIIYI